MVNPQPLVDKKVIRLAMLGLTRMALPLCT